ncbi:AAA family ATPase [Nocardioides sp. CFH 31398]|uniref:AAA family ATPase n=1 Tax=Nocardioides sp. CFH 31398 TaxID=2919579 RepID=UPI001F065898|nr:SMC family ATPase [Nocardioides sp. CFH 31398]MCH1866969.1 SMC family ATPase [Nocardioides sp. CFH 31398]
MRVHRLEVTAFGPFAETVVVDGDALAADGLFLLSGPTGAGKSSVLDAICFALYGAVPGRRNEARALRCDRSDPGLATRVVLDVSLGDRRYRFTRSPAWERPKKRGDGTTTQQASASVQQRVGETWRHETNRLDEAGDLVGRLLGMTCSQFCQVAMLPQGEFSTFLQARSDDRQQVLAQLFRTDRYDRIAAWLVEHRRATRRTEEAARVAVDAVRHRLGEAAGTVPGDASPEGVLDDGWLADLRASTARAADVARDEDAAAHATLDATRAELESGLATARAQEAHTSARARQHVLDAAAPQRHREAARLDAARRAAPIALLDAQAAAAEADLAVARRRWSAAAGRAGVTDPDAVDGALQECRRRLGRLLDARPAETELGTARADAARAARATEAARAALARADDALAALPARVEELAEEHTRLGAVAAGLPGLLEAGARARDARRAARTVVELEALLVEATALADDARELKHARHEAWLAVREARLEGIAAELAGGLAVGGHCPVCGSCDHPRPATRGADAVDLAAERRARASLDDAESALLAHTDRVQGLRVRLAGAREGAGGHDEAWWQQEQERLEQATTAATVARNGAARALRALAEAEGALTAAREHRSGLASEVAAAETAERSARTAADDAERRLRALLDAAGGLTGALEEAVTVTGAQEAALEAAQRAAGELATARAQAARSLAHAEASAVAHRFDDLAAARAAVLDDAERGRLEAAAQAHRDGLREVHAVLADPVVRAAATEDAPDLAATRARLAAAEAMARDAATRAAQARERRDRVDVLAGQHDAAVAAWLPAAEAARRAEALADLATGRSADNRLRLSLSAYVLSWRLGQVVDAANVRLAPMTDGRFTLLHDAALPTRGGRRGGLDLVVRDEWSGAARAPVTLSGGETFVVSLALALGLADVVSQEAAADAVGVDIDTLFVDEGFGSLDADTLEDVMGVLDDLRAGGRVVGVVSHVESMRERIGRRLEVTPGSAGGADGDGGARGSRVRLVVAGA